MGKTRLKTDGTAPNVGKMTLRRDPEYMSLLYDYAGCSQKMTQRVRIFSRYRDQSSSFQERIFSKRLSLHGAITVTMTEKTMLQPSKNGWIPPSRVICTDNERSTMA